MPPPITNLRKRKNPNPNLVVYVEKEEVIEENDIVPQE